MSRLQVRTRLTGSAAELDFRAAANSRPLFWGVIDDVVERFIAAGIPGHNIACAPDTFVFEAPVSPTEYLTWFRDYYGPIMNAFEAAASNGRAEDLFGELDALFNTQNTSGDPARTAIAATYLPRHRERVGGTSRHHHTRSNSDSLRPGDMR